MVQILNRRAYGYETAQGLGDNLNRLLEMKIQQKIRQAERDYEKKQRQEERSEIYQDRIKLAKERIPYLRSQFPGRPDEELLSLAFQEPSLQTAAYKEQLEGPANREYNAIRQEFLPGFIPQQGQPTAASGFEEEVKQATPAFNPQESLQNLLNTGQPQPLFPPFATRLNQPNMPAPVPAGQQAAGLPPQIPAGARPTAPAQNTVMQGLDYDINQNNAERQKLGRFLQAYPNNKKALTRLDKLESTNRDLQKRRDQIMGNVETERHHKVVEAQAEKKEGRGEREFGTKINLPFINESRTAGMNAETNINNLQTIDKLANKGELRAGNVQQLLSKAGLGNVGLNPDSQVVNALANQMAIGATKTLKGAISNKELDVIRSTVPSLYNSVEGIQRLAKGSIELNKANKALYDEMKKVRKEYKDKGLALPDDFQDEVYERALPKIQKHLQKMTDYFTGTAKSEFTLGQKWEKLPDASKFPATARIKAGKELLKPSGNKWVKA